MSNRKIFCLHFEREISDDEYRNVPDSFYKEYELFEGIKKQMFNSKLKCKNCKKSFRDMVLTGVVGCPICYNSVMKAVSDEKFLPSLVSSEIEKFFFSTGDYKYKGKRPMYSKKYFDISVKVSDLKRELEYSIELEDYERCDVLKKTIEEMESKMLKFRREIDG